MAAAKQDIVIEQGSVFELTVIYKRDGVVQDLSGAGVRMQVRSDYGVNPPLISLLLDNGIEVDAPKGQIMITIPADATADLAAPSNAVYDLEVVPAGDDAQARRVLEGRAYVTPQVTLP